MSRSDRRPCFTPSSYWQWLERKAKKITSVFLCLWCYTVCVCVGVCVGTTYGSWPIHSWDQHRPLPCLSSNCKWINKFKVCVQTAFKHVDAMIRWCRIFCLFLFLMICLLIFLSAGHLHAPNANTGRTICMNLQYSMHTRALRSGRLFTICVPNHLVSDVKGGDAGATWMWKFATRVAHWGGQREVNNAVKDAWGALFYKIPSEVKYFWSLTLFKATEYRLRNILPSISVFNNHDMCGYRHQPQNWVSVRL